VRPVSDGPHCSTVAAEDPPRKTASRGADVGDDPSVRGPEPESAPLICQRGIWRPELGIGPRDSWHPCRGEGRHRCSFSTGGARTSRQLGFHSSSEAGGPLRAGSHLRVVHCDGDHGCGSDNRCGASASVRTSRVACDPGDGQSKYRARRCSSRLHGLEVGEESRALDGHVFEASVDEPAPKVLGGAATPKAPAAGPDEQPVAPRSTADDHAAH
jgi:hypothetical protein